MRILVDMLRSAAETAGLGRTEIEVHIRIASPPIVGCCYYGIDTPELDELAASSHSTAEICKMIDADSLQYLSLEGLDSVAAQFDEPKNFCHACFTGHYPTPYLERSRQAPSRSL
jgi:amidophosphoribosyltransferase